MEAAETRGIAAGLCTTIAFLPQAAKTWRTRSAHDLSRGMFILQVCGNLLWLAYGMERADVAIAAANAATVVLAGSVLYFKLRYG
jgi:MtN3 and saliva related transmembrane protein